MGGTVSKTSRMVAAMNGSTMIAKTKPAVKMPMPKGGPMNNLLTPGMDVRMLDQPWLNVPLQHRCEHEQAPYAENDAGHRCQQFDRHADRAFQHRRAQFGQKQGNSEARRYRQRHGDQGGDHRAVDRRQRTVLIGDRIPNFTGNEGEAEVPRRRPGPAQQRDGHASQDEQHQNRSRKRPGPEDPLVNQLLCGVPRIDDRHDVSFAPAATESGRKPAHCSRAGSGHMIALKLNRILSEATCRSKPDDHPT